MPESGVHAAAPASPLHAILLAFPVALYPSALISDITYLQTSVVQWTNFSQWLIAGADLFAGLLLAWTIASLLFGRARHARGRGKATLIVVAVMFVLGIINALQHSKDGWASVGTTGLILSIACTILAIVAAFLVHSRTIVREVRP
ncbi:putative membrane protein [Novosphingobium hassiacum]|uniref:Putative membrane protein n=1 Tax=Novosphingobium hassiacum TaxID=173676 RepID=A0A7W5ZVC9_9SPHN|nr:DUF2231 domain-containing protein [Novosphingobium hassiacum]MBB3860646.1 putative membrane protein [Novosphingobium hassiacum]